MVTTIDGAGNVNVAPMGPDVGTDGSRLTLRPFRGSRTFENLRSSRQGVFHVVDDVEMLAAAAVGDITPPMRRAELVDGYVLEAACQAFEFRVVDIDETSQRSRMEARILRRESMRDFCGWNRAKHAVLEAAILATRVRLLPREEIKARLESLRVLVEKTGGAAERRAFRALEDYVETGPRGETSPARAARRSGEEGAGTCVRVRAGARLHFGLIAPGPLAPRRFGGAGLMVEEPRLVVTVERAAELEVSGSLADRAAEFARGFSGQSSPPYRLHVESARHDHVGLGTGTQLALAVARGMTHFEGGDPSAALLAAQLGRGARSAVGVHGFARGGFLVEAGRRPDAIAPLVGRYRFPPDWRVVIVLPPGPQGVSGAAEERAFKRIESPPEAVIDRLSRLLLLGMIPALAEADLDSFGDALYEYGYRSGEAFARFQSGVFATPRIEAVVRFLRSDGVRGVGQSSWGPAVYAVLENDAAARRVVERLAQRFSLEARDLIVTPARDAGAEVELERSVPSLHTLA